MNKTIQILDYGSGNLFSIFEAISRVSTDVEPVIDSKFLDHASALILPGVGSFSSAQRILGDNREAIMKAVTGEHMPILGVCLGMQLMFEKSEEGQGEGLGFFKGSVKRFSSGSGVKVPHMGWNEAVMGQRRSRLTEGLEEKEWAYYVHSYYPVPNDESIVEAWTNYGKAKFPSIISKENIFGTQFHPEKSHVIGAKMISNFVSLVAESDDS